MRTMAWPGRPRSRSWPWPHGFLGMLVLIAVAEFSVKRRPDRFATIDRAAWSFPEAMMPRACQAEALAFGDSLVKFGVLPKVIERRLGLRAYNLAIPGGETFGSCHLLRRALAGGARPKVVFVDGETLTFDPCKHVDFWPEVASLAATAEFAWTARDPSYFARAMGSHLLPSFKVRFQIREWLLAELDERPAVLRPITHLPLYRRNWNKNLGAELATPYDENSRGVLDGRTPRIDLKDYQPTHLPIRAMNAWYAERFVALAESRGIVVFWLSPPLPPEVEARREHYGWYRDMEPFLRGLMDRHANLTVVDGRGAGYDLEHFRDMVHLDAKGAISFTNALSAIVRDQLDGGRSGSGRRWVELTPLRAGESARLAAEFDDEVEDIEESLAAFKDVRDTNPLRLVEWRSPGHPEARSPRPRGSHAGPSAPERPRPSPHSVPVVRPFRR